MLKTQLKLFEKSIIMNIFDYEYNGVITSQISINDDIVDSYDYTLVAYNGNECIGFADPLYFPLDDKQDEI